MDLVSGISSARMLPASVKHRLRYVISPAYNRRSFRQLCGRLRVMNAMTSRSVYGALREGEGGRLPPRARIDWEMCRQCLLK